MGHVLQVQGDVKPLPDIWLACLDPYPELQVHVLWGLGDIQQPDQLYQVVVPQEEKEEQTGREGAQW